MTRTTRRCGPDGLLQDLRKLQQEQAQVQGERQKDSASNTRQLRPSRQQKRRQRRVPSVVRMLKLHRSGLRLLRWSVCARKLQDVQSGLQSAPLPVRQRCKSESQRVAAALAAAAMTTTRTCQMATVKAAMK